MFFETDLMRNHRKYVCFLELVDASAAEKLRGHLLYVFSGIHTLRAFIIYIHIIAMQLPDIMTTKTNLNFWFLEVFMFLFSLWLCFGPGWNSSHLKILDVLE